MSELQRIFKRGKDSKAVIEVRTLTRCGASQQSLVELEALTPSTSDG